MTGQDPAQVQRVKESDDADSTTGVVEQIAIGFRLDDALVGRIADAFPAIPIIHRPELLPPRRYPCDHIGDTTQVGPGYEKAIQEAFSEATVLLGAPLQGPEALREIVMKWCPRLRWIQGTASGFGEVVEAASLPTWATQQVAFTTAAGIHAQQLAEWALLSLMYFRKDVPQVLQDQKERQWRTRAFDEISDSTVLVLGLGHVGGRVAKVCASLGMRVMGVGSGSSEDEFWHIGETDDESVLRNLVRKSDAVVLCLPQTKKTTGLFSSTLIDALPPHGVVVNIGRGTTIDNDALALALSEGRLRGAALDVTSPEPLPATHQLWTLPNVLVSSHSAALSIREDERLVDLFIENLARYLSGDALINRINTHYPN